LLEPAIAHLLGELLLESVDPGEPVQVHRYPQPWRLLGAGNYAAVFGHPDYDHFAVKVYAPGRPGLREEVEVYRRLGRHPSYSECYFEGPGFLVLKRLDGVTIYDCIRRGIPVTDQAIRDIDDGLEFARSRGLHPHDVHAKNVMVRQGRGLIVDVSDFLKQEDCGMWDDFKKIYYRLYRPVASRKVFPVPRIVLELVRKGYQRWRRRKK
jgi:hypothetical protein